MNFVDFKASAGSDRSFLKAAKPHLTVHEVDAPNAETPAHLLDSDLTPEHLFFVRTNGRLPKLDVPAEQWEVVVEGEVRRSLAFRLPELMQRFPRAEVAAVLECAGNGRVYFEQSELEFEWEPGTVAWGPGAVGCATFSGIRLCEVLDDAGLTGRAVYTAFESPDRDCQHDRPAISRGLPVWKAMAPEVLLATHMNGRPLSYLHGAPVRVVAPGFPGSAWQKWLTRIWVRDCEHDGPKMTGTDYRMPTRQYSPGEPHDPADFAVIEDLPLKTLITAPAEGAIVQDGEIFEVRGFAWSGQTPVSKVEISLDDGRSWTQAELCEAIDRFAWRRFRSLVRAAGTVNGGSRPMTVIARGTDASGHAQPVEAAVWNPRGYLNDQAHRVTVQIQG